MTDSEIIKLWRKHKEVMGFAHELLGKGAGMKPKLIPLLEQCIETGVQRGWDRAFKHDDDPPADTVRERIREAIWLELHEWFDFDGTEPQPLFDDWGGFPYKGNK